MAGLRAGFSQRPGGLFGFQADGGTPLFQVEKNPHLANRQGLYAVTSQAGRVLKRGHDLAPVLRVMEHPLRLVKP